MVDPQRHRDAIFDRRFTALVQAGAALSTIGSWDDRLSRRTRILVPVDVQAFVVPIGGGEATVAMTGGPGDPPPFEVGSVRPAGVHLHWAMPDALLSGASDPTGATLDLPHLPDRWVVVRTLQPLGSRDARSRGWVIDARTGSVTPLASYAGTPDPAPPDTPVLEPLDGAAGGSLMWTASYEASAGRFGFHDPLDDLTTGEKFAGDQAAYTVAGWWSDLGEDPLAAATGPRRLDARLADLGWYVVHDADDEALVEEDPRLRRLRDGMGMPSPKDAAPARITGADGRTVSGALDDIAFTVRSPVRAADLVVMTPALPRYATLVHGSVLGVPVTGALPPADDRPDAAAVGLALGQDVDDVVSASGAQVLGLDPTLRRSAETLVAAFTSGLIEQIGSPDGLEDLAEREHGDGFWSLPGAPLPAAKPDRLRAEDTAPLGPTRVGRKGRAAQPPRRLDTRLGWADAELTLTSGTGSGAAASPRTEETQVAPGGAALSESREVVRPAPRYFRPQPPMLALLGVRPNHRHHGDGLYDEQGRLRCRYPRECVPAIDGVVTGTAVLGSLGSGAVPEEVLTVVREAVLLNLYGYQWLAEAGAADASMVDAYRTRLAAEMVRLYGVDGRYDGTSHLAATPARAIAPGESWQGRSTRDEVVDRQITAELAQHALVSGTPPSPVAITTWRQPWVPLWLEWKVTLDGHDSTTGWQLTGLDLDPTPDPPADPGAEVSLTLLGRSPLSQGVSRALHEGIRRWREAELQRDATGSSTLPTSDQDLLGRLGDLLAPLDLVSASLDGLREQLLGIPYVGVLHSADDNDGSDGSVGGDSLPRATGSPVTLFGGTLRIDALRLVDAFGRVLDIPPEAIAGTATTLDLAVDGLAGGMRMRPRIQHLARALFRLVDPAQPAATDPAEIREAYVDQLDPAAAVNPVAGFLLPDHIDEALEAFTVGGEPIGQLGHDAVNGAVTWETAPGRPLPPDAGPLAGLDVQARITGEIAAGLVQADVMARDLDQPPGISALSALLRVIDTTLWTVDTYAAIGSPTVAGLVGRPVAVVRATLRLDAPDDLDEVDVVAPGGVSARRAAYDAMREQRFAFRLGALTRTDDALLGFYLDDDYAHLRLVDRAIAAQAIDSGRQRGQLGLLGQVAVPDVDPLVHPYVIPDGTILLRPGQTVRLTLLTLPVGRVHLTSGVLPRKQLALSDEWTSPGLRRLVPSVRVGPVLVDPAEIRLPLVTLLGDKQTFTRRTGPLTWRDDPIVAATQTAYLPRLPHEAQEGWIRVTPAEPTNAPNNEPGGTP